jgi:hypothetical protein
MAATPKEQQKVKLDIAIDKEIYDNFMRACSKKGYAPRTVLERLIGKYNETGQM